MRRPAFGAGPPCATGQISFLPKAILTFVIVLLAALNLHAQFPTQKPAGYVNDIAGVLSPAARQQLEALCAELDQKTKAQLAIVTVRSLEGRPLEEFTVDLATKWGIGPKGSDRGVMLFLAIQDRRSRIEVGYGLEPIIPDGRAGSILRAMTPYLRNNDYDGAMRLGATTIAQIIAQDARVSLQALSAPQPRSQPVVVPSLGFSFRWGAEGLPLIVGSIVYLFAVAFVYSSLQRFSTRKRLWITFGGFHLIASALVGNLIDAEGNVREFLFLLVAPAYGIGSIALVVLMLEGLLWLLGFDRSSLGRGDGGSWGSGGSGGGGFGGGGFGGGSFGGGGASGSW